MHAVRGVAVGVRWARGAPPPRASIASAALSALAVFAVFVGSAGCSALVQFHDQPSCEGGLCEDASTTHAQALDAQPAADGQSADAPSDAVSPPPAPDHYAPCAGLRSGYYCANDGPDGFAGPATDLLYCDDGGGIGQAKACDAGCLHIPDPFPDACNPCPGVPNGVYCGRDLAGFPADNADFLIQCQNGDTVQQVTCLHGCGSNGAMSACYAG
jgi:hypothetical protein